VDYSDQGALTKSELKRLKQTTSTAIPGAKQKSQQPAKALAATTKANAQSKAAAAKDDKKMPQKVHQPDRSDSFMLG
jgi:hypothetical protein